MKPKKKVCMYDFLIPTLALIPFFPYFGYDCFGYKGFCFSKYFDHYLNGWKNISFQRKIVVVLCWNEPRPGTGILERALERELPGFGSWHLRPRDLNPFGFSFPHL